jgi:tetratricopeptide (TPR) repeat protein
VETLDRLHQGAASRITAVLPEQQSNDSQAQALQGLGGVGKTAIAIEYAHRFQADYDIVWWIAADQLSSARAALARLAARLELDIPPAAGTDGAVRAVLSALSQGEPTKRWLLIYDNADVPDDIYPLIPRGAGDVLGPGDVLVTSRNQDWQEIIDTVPMDVFTREESLAFLARRVPAGLGSADANRLADKLGDLPLALDQAGAMLAETGMAAEEYLRLIDEQVSEVMDEGRSAGYPRSMTAAWALSVSALEAQSPSAIELLRVCAFFAPYPIPSDVFRRGASAARSPVAEVISDPVRFPRAIRELGRFALVTLEGRTVLMHRLVQALLRAGLTAEQRDEYRRDVHAILAKAAPTDPDNPPSWASFRDLLPHISAEWTELPRSREPAVRDLALRMMRYAEQSGDYQACLDLAEGFIDQWSKDSPDEDPDVLRAQRHMGNALRNLGRFAASSELTSATLSQSRRALGETDPTTLSLRTANAADLRANGKFQDARSSDEQSRELFEATYGQRDSRTLRLLASLALDYGLNSRFQLCKDLYVEASQFMAEAGSYSTNADKLSSAIGLGWALRHLGEYEDALGVLQEARALAEDPESPAPEHLASLRSANGYTVVCRRIPERRLEALQLARSIYGLSSRQFGDGHPDTLAIAIGLSNLLRNISVDHHDEAVTIAESVVRQYPEVYGATHPYYYGSLSNLAVLRRTADAGAARELNERALNGLDETIGRDHHYSLTVAVNLASDYASLGDLPEAKRLGDNTWQRLTALLGVDHPMALGCAVNLSFDLRTLGEEALADKLFNDAIETYRQKLGATHPDTKVAASGRRLDPDFDPPPI